MNFGCTPNEIAEQLRLPATLKDEPSVCALYGTLAHNSKAVYQRYLGGIGYLASRLLATGK